MVLWQVLLVPLWWFVVAIMAPRVEVKLGVGVLLVSLWWLITLVRAVAWPVLGRSLWWLITHIESSASWLIPGRSPWWYTTKNVADPVQGAGIAQIDLVSIPLIPIGQWWSIFFTPIVLSGHLATSYVVDGCLSILAIDWGVRWRGVLEFLIARGGLLLGVFVLLVISSVVDGCLSILAI
ncbi:hypothetical protein BJX99DRAFT_222831, partial [Aspergillus californicus]